MESGEWRVESESNQVGDNVPARAPGDDWGSLPQSDEEVEALLQPLRGAFATICSEANALRETVSNPRP